jgi:hypothetical protein
MHVNLIHSILVFQEKNIVYMTMRVNLIHSKPIFLKKIQKLNTLKKRKKRVHLNGASELHRARKQRISKSSYELLCKIRVQNVKLYRIHQN